MRNYSLFLQHAAEHPLSPPVALKMPKLPTRRPVEDTDETCFKTPDRNNQLISENDDDGAYLYTLSANPLDSSEGEEDSENSVD